MSQDANSNPRASEEQPKANAPEGNSEEDQAKGPEEEVITIVRSKDRKLEFAHEGEWIEIRESIAYKPLGHMRRKWEHSQVLITEPELRLILGQTTPRRKK